MNQRLFLSVTAFALLGLVPPPAARAQYNPFPVYNPGRVGGGAAGFRPYFGNTLSGPRLSPYLLLNNNPAAGIGNLSAVNFYLGVLPEIERRNTQTLFQSEIQGLTEDLNRRTTAAPAVSGLESELFGGTLPPTGHGVAFLNPAPYYNTGGAGRGPAVTSGQRGAGTGRAPSSQPTYIPGTGAKGSGMK
jgi:hypothetical protein